MTTDTITKAIEAYATPEKFNLAREEHMLRWRSAGDSVLVEYKPFDDLPQDQAKSTTLVIAELQAELRERNAKLVEEGEPEVTPEALIGEKIEELVKDTAKGKKKSKEKDEDKEDEDKKDEHKKPGPPPHPHAKH
jgi:hypothetical protein